MSEDLIVLREILQRELETINAYERMLERVSDPTLREIISHVTDEEREHVAEMYHLIVARDPQQQARSERGRIEVARLAPGHGVASETATAAAGLGGDVITPNGGAPVSRGLPQTDLTPPPPPFFPDGAWSVGSLKVRSA